jgi:hypothetical protein
MEELVLTDPVVEPEKVTHTYKVIVLTLNWDIVTNLVTGEKGLVSLDRRDNLGQPCRHQYTGQEAIDLMKWMNTANFSVNSMHKRILQKLTNDGVLVGTVTGTPDTPPVVE